MLEDEVVVGLAEIASANGCNVIVAAANQISVFAYKLPSGRRKAPDLAVLDRDSLFLFEVKVQARALFERLARKESDVESLALLLSSPIELASIEEEAKRRLIATYGRAPAKITVACGVAAADDITPFRQALVNAGLFGISVDVVRRTAVVVVPSHPTPNFV